MTDFKTTLTALVDYIATLNLISLVSYSDEHGGAYGIRISHPQEQFPALTMRIGNPRVNEMNNIFIVLTRGTDFVEYGFLVDLLSQCQFEYSQLVTGILFSCDLQTAKKIIKKYRQYHDEYISGPTTGMITRLIGICINSGVHMGDLATIDDINLNPLKYSTYEIPHATTPYKIPNRSEVFFVRYVSDVINKYAKKMLL